LSKNCHCSSFIIIQIIK